jgi:hypothetical protein
MVAGGASEGGEGSPCGISQQVPSIPNGWRGVALPRRAAASWAGRRPIGGLGRRGPGSPPGLAERLARCGTNGECAGTPHNRLQLVSMLLLSKWAGPGAQTAAYA